jgi:thioredoxin 1
LNTIISFFGLYLYSLFSFDAYAAAEASPFNVNKIQAPPARAGTQDRNMAAPKLVGRKVGTLADLKD